MDIYRHSGHTVYAFNKKVVCMKNKNKTRFWFRGKIVPNHRFNIHPHKQWQYFHWFIRLPFFYFEKNNGGVKIGTPDKYLWFIKLYRDRG